MDDAPRRPSPPLSADRWRALSPLLDEALDMTSDRRPAWLAALSARDASLADDLRRLLAEHDTVHRSHFLEMTMPLSRPAPPLAQPLEGQVLGAYRLVSPIGQGGMGSVWLAERCDGRFEGRAAVELLNVALVGRAGEERFRREGTILARLTHPGIARLTDAGVSPAGQPYLVLEHVDGRHIDRYCDERALGIEARLRLFLDVLSAVAHAHANLIVHRDIKPPNVIVSVDGHVKLLDFGIAKLLEGAAGMDGLEADTSALTREAGAVLTPEYAAPEQLSGRPVTTATDVYALGVLLHVLLTGQHPAGRDARSPAALIRAIVDVEPRRASDVVVDPAEPADALAAHAASRSMTPARLQRLLRGDLDVIIATALKKDPAERYTSVTALADDVKRYLRREPISARPDTVRYRAARFLRRHARSVAASAAVVVLLAASTAYHTNRLAKARDRAQLEAAKAAKVSDLLTGLLSGADPYAFGPRREEPTVRGLLDAGSARVQRELAGQPELQAEILTTMGRIYRRLGAFDKAQPLLEQALASGVEAFGAEHPTLALTLHDLGVLQADRGDYTGAQARLELALAMRRRLLGAEHAEVAVTLSELGRVYQDQGRNDAAEPLHGEALRVRRKVLGDEDPEVAVSLSDLGSVLRLEGDLDGAEALLRQSLVINQRARGEDHPNTAVSRHDLALIAAARGDYAGAGAELDRVLILQRRGLGAGHPNVAATLHNMARVLAAEGRHDEAAARLREAIEIARAALGGEHQLVAIYTVTLGSVELARRRPADAETLLRQGLRIRQRSPHVVPSRRRTLPEDDWSLDAIRRLLGAALVAQGRHDEAETVLLDRTDDTDVARLRPAPAT